jgi:hypothetical protein
MAEQQGPPTPHPSIAPMLRARAPEYDRWAAESEREAEDLQARGNVQGARLVLGRARMHRHHADAARAGRAW